MENQAKIKHGLKIRTSFVSPLTLKALVENEWLPIFIIRHIDNNTLISKYAGTPVHLFWLAPNSDLFHSWRDGVLDWEDYADLYADDILSTVRMKDLIERLEILRSTSGAKGVVLMGYGENMNTCHRSVLAKLINQSDLLLDPVKEIVV